MSAPPIDRALRVAHEAEVYDARAGELRPALGDDELRVDASYVPFPNREHVDFLSYALERVGPLAGRRMLEVGCGGGTLSVWLALQGAQVTGVDVSEGMLALARARAAVSGAADRVRFVRVPIEDLDDPDGAYDVIFGNQVLHHTTLPLAAANLRRLLAPDGIAVFCEPVLFLPAALVRLRYHPAVLRVFPSRTDTPDEHAITRDELAALLAAFPHGEWRPFQLTCRLQNFRPVSDRAFARLERLDRALLARVPASALLCRYVVITLAHDRAGRRSP